MIRDRDRRATKRGPACTGSAAGGAWSSSAIVGLIVVILIAVGVLLYGVNKVITTTDSTATSAPSTTGEGAAR
ncbi:MAG TPA: hypothetical protein VGH39_14840 [Xanthobacteraceae bacterium]|jgi:hypothetical protein